MPICNEFTINEETNAMLAERLFVLVFEADIKPVLRVNDSIEPAVKAFT